MGTLPYSAYFKACSRHVAGFLRATQLVIDLLHLVSRKIKKRAIKPKLSPLRPWLIKSYS